jgi:peroxiredoxin Q/BCP
MTESVGSKTEATKTGPTKTVEATAEGAPRSRRGLRSLVVKLGLGALQLACGAVQRPDGGTGLLAMGASAPDLTGVTREGNRVSLSSVRGHPAVVYFNPKDETHGCTRESSAFRDAFDQYVARQVTIFGVSQDSAESHRAFSEHQKLPFPLVADEDGSAARAYGVPSHFGFTSRMTFLVDASGRIAHVWPDVDPGVHSHEVLAAVAGLGG